MSDRTIWDRPSLHSFITDMIYSGPITLHIEPRPDVATRKWFTLTFVAEDEQTQVEVSGSSLGIVLRRASARVEALRASEEVGRERQR